jgi:hypothetical protein
VQHCALLNKDSHVGSRKFSVRLPLRRPQHAVSNIEDNNGRLLKMYIKLQHVDDKDIEAADSSLRKGSKRALPQDF